ncbi:MAG: hypothetical protein Q9199_002478 [Rusavskia elegans]
MEESLQVHVFASLYSFSDGARDEILSKFSEKAAFLNAHAEWRDNKFLCISSNDEASVTALFNLYNEYVNKEKQRAYDPYEVSKLQRPPATLTKMARLETPLQRNDSSDIKDVYNVEDSSNILVTHETISRVWSLSAELVKSTPKRLITFKMFEQIANRASCRIVSKTEAGVLTVKGDNGQDLSQTLERLDNFAQALYSRQVQPQTYNLVIPEEEGTDVRFRLTPLEDHEASDHRSTTMIDQRLLGSQPPNLAVILKTAKNGAILTCSRNSRDSAGSTTWRYTLIPSYGDQDINLAAFSYKHSTGSQTRSTQAPGALPELAPKSIAEWVAAIPSRGDDPSKPPNLSIENSPLAWVDGVETGDDDTETSQPKRRFGRNRKKPGLDDITEIEDHGVTTFDYTNDDHHSTLTMPLSSEEGKLSSELNLQPDTAGSHLSAKLASSTLSTSKTPSHSGSQKSPPADTSSSTPSTQSSTHHDLLMSAEPALAYPVMIPISNPATNCQDIGSPTPQATSQVSFAQAPPPPAWVRRNVTSQAENQRPGLLVDCADTQRPSSQPVSYLAAAKRGTSTVGTRGLSGGPANVNHGSNLLHQLQPPTSSPDQAQSVNWSDPKTSRRARKARSKVATVATQTVQLQDNAVRRVDNDLSQPDDSVVVQLLQLAKGLGGIVRMEVEIGRILVKTDSIQPSKSVRWANVYNAWSSIFGLGDRQTETIFTNRLPNPHTDLGFPSNLKEMGGQQVFTHMPHDCSVRYEFLCTTILGDEDVVFDVSQSGDVQVFAEHVVGAFQWHFPKRQWDARLIAKTSERIEDYEDAVKAVGNSLSVIPSPDQTTASLFADLGNSGLIFKSASILREVHFRCLTDPNISMTCTETQYLGVAKDRQRFFNSPLDRAAAEAKGDLWWEIKLESTNTSTELQQGNWTAEEIVQAGVAQRLQAVAIDIVTQIDGIGAHIKQAATEVFSRTAPTESWRASKVVASDAATFW